MTYETYETSLQDGAPVELYEFRRDSMRWRYTSGNDQVTINGSTWDPVPINRSSIENTTSADKSSIKIEVTRDNPVAELYRVRPPSDVVLLYVYRYHREDEDTRVLWIGKIMNCDWKGSIATLSCEPASVSMNRTGLRRMYQRSCQHKLYGSKCGVTRGDYEVTGLADAVASNVVTISEAGAEADGYFVGGGLEWVDGNGMTERRLITAHTGSDLTLTLGITGMAAGGSVTIYPGCAKTTSACLNKFANLDNYGGFPYIPTNGGPFDGKSLSY